MVRAVPLSSTAVSPIFGEGSFVVPGAARTTFIVVTKSNARTHPPSRNRRGFSIDLPLWHLSKAFGVVRRTPAQWGLAENMEWSESTARHLMLLDRA